MKDYAISAYSHDSGCTQTDYITAEHVEFESGALILTDERGDLVIAYAPGVWNTVQPEGADHSEKENCK